MPDRRTRRRPGHGDRALPPVTGPWDQPDPAAEDLFTPRRHPSAPVPPPAAPTAPPRGGAPDTAGPAQQARPAGATPAAPFPAPGPSTPPPPPPTSRRARRLAEAAAQARGGELPEAAPSGWRDRAAEPIRPDPPVPVPVLRDRDPVRDPVGDPVGDPVHDEVHDEPGRHRSPRLLLPVALLLAAWSVTCLVDEVGQARVDALLVALAATSPYLALAAVPVVTLALRGRRWLSAGAGLVGGLLPWVFVLGYAAPAPQQEEPRGPTVRTLIVNAHLGQADPAAVVQAVRDHAVDVLVVTELSGLLAHELTGQGLDAQLRPRWVQVPDQAQSGIGLWSRFDVGAVEEVAGTARPALRTRIDTGAGTLTLVTGHAVPPLPDVEQWRADLRALGGAARVEGPVLLLGNLNATPWHPEFRRLAGEGLDDAADAAGRGLRSTWPSASPVPLLPLAHALVGGGVGTEEVETILVGGTNHRALLTTVVLPG